jgi:uncharacterized protein (TIGR03437 family)
MTQSLQFGHFSTTMRSYSLPILVVLAAVCSPAADFTTGQAARALIGQKTFTVQAYGATESLLGGVSGLAYVNDTLIVADSNRVNAEPVNNRVMIFNNVSSFLPKPTDELRYDRQCPVCVGSASVVVGQPDFTTVDSGLSERNLRTPTAVASDGRILAVADTDNNRVLIWKSIPASNNTPADIVLGQPDFKTRALPRPGDNTPTNWSMRGPQGVWIQNGRLYVADTQNHRVLIWNSIPTQNKQPADVVLGQPNFETAPEPDLTQAKVEAKATNLLNPVAVTSDGQRLYVTDLGHNRVLVWNSIPTQNQQPADLAIGQPDVASTADRSAADSNNVKYLCEPTGKDDKGNDIYPAMCNATLSFPRYALSDGQRLFIADGGNDRVLVYSQVPTRSGAPADFVLGQIDPRINIASDATDSLRTPLSLAWDGVNLYVSDAYNRRIMIYSVGENSLPYTAVRNAASRQIYAVGSITFSGAVKDGQEVTVKINDTEYKYKTVKDDDFAKVINALVGLINAGKGDPNVLATPNLALDSIILTARQSGEPGNNVAISVTTSTDATITAKTSGANLTGGMDAAKVAPGTIVSILGDNLADDTASVSPDRFEWPTEMAGVQVYFNGIRAPLQFVSPGQINAQIPYEVLDETSLNAYVRTVRRDGRVTVTTPVAVTIVGQNPGIFAAEGADPRPGSIVHYSSNATGTVSVDGSVKAGEVATVIIGSGETARKYSYTVQEGDDLAKIRDGLIALINQDPEVEAFAAGVFTRIRLRARVPGPAGNGLKYSVQTADGSQVILTPTTPGLCCASEAGSLVTEENPAQPGETIVVYATGLGLMKSLEGMNTGQKYTGPGSEPREFVSSLAGGKTANVLYASLVKGMVGVYEVDLELNSDLPTNPQTQLTIAQSIYVSNVVTVPVYNPAP